jgi:PAT family beta-lactamase induction signal transducer AmpG
MDRGPRFWRALARRKVATMLALGFASGLPIWLVGNTLGYWLREEGIALAAIGFLSWVGIAYSLKFLWAPLIDKADAPLFGRWLGRRRGWMALSQLVVIVGLAGMAFWQPQGGLTTFGLLALLTAFASATQDIVVDAWRIESAEHAEEIALLTSASQLGYRSALLVTDALILILAASIGWVLSYHAMAALMLVGLAATLLAAEPPAHAAPSPPLASLKGLGDAIAGPFIAFFQAHGRNALLMLAAVSLYRLPDFLLGPMANPFYADLGLAKEAVGAVRGSVGLAATFAGVAGAGLMALRFGFVATLLAGAVLGPGSNLAFVALAVLGPGVDVLAGVMIVDNFATGFAGAALVAYMSSLTSLGYTATQYALLSSFYALLGKFLKGFSGAAVEALTVNGQVMPAYALYFTGTALMGLPALLLCVWLARRLKTQASG